MERSASGTFLVFASACALGYLWSTYFVPETANVSLEEMDAVFGSSAGREDIALKHQVRLPPREVGVTYKVTRRLTRRCARRSRKTWACTSSCGSGHARAGVRQLLVLVAIIAPIELVDIVLIGLYTVDTSSS